LDVGCGIGHLVPYIDEDTHYLGIDSSDEMLKAHESFFHPRLIGNLEPTSQLRTLLMDATDLRKLDESDRGKTQFSTTIAMSLLLHLPRETAIQVLKEMWERTVFEMVFSMETCGNTTQKRESGLILRNQGVDSICKDLVENLEVKPSQISWAHQSITYESRQRIIPSRPEPLTTYPPRMIARTTLFSVTTGNYERLKA